MQVRTPDTDVGVIIGRFQVPTLHDGHKGLIDHVLSKHKKVLILVGSTPGIRATRRQPLDYHTRLLMIQEEYSQVLVAPITDMPSDEDWSRMVDGKIYDTFQTPSAALYGSRDGFIPHYSGRYETVELASSIDTSGSKVRKDISDEVRQHEEFRRGVIYSSFARFPTMYATVDVAILNDLNDWMIALCRKHNDPPGMYRFPGGFADPNQDKTFLEAAKREAEEELVGGIFKDFEYVGSTLVHDWRYRSESDSIMTTLFAAKHHGGELEPGDDLRGGEIKWFNVRDMDDEILLPQHRGLITLVRNHIGCAVKKTKTKK